MSEQEPDINNLLANARKSFALKVALYRQMAIEAREQLDGPNGPAYGHQFRAEIAQAEASAQLWSDREAEAGRGYLLGRQEELNDYSFTSEYGPLLTLCQVASRVVYHSTINDQRLQQGSVDGASAV
jgi:hypothetical protein